MSRCRHALNRRDSRRGIKAVNNYDFFRFPLTIPYTPKPPKGYTLNPVTIGQHIRKIRIDKGLMQSQVAKKVKVTASTVWNWEHGTSPEIRHLPSIIKFLGYVPFPCPDDPIGKLQYFKNLRGLSYKRLGVLMKRDPEQLTDWLSGRNKPCNKNLEEISAFLSEGRLKT